MRTTLFSVLVILAHSGMAAAAQAQAGAVPATAPAATSGHPLAKRLFFFTSDSKSTGRIVARPRAGQNTGARVFFRPNQAARPMLPFASHSTVKAPATGLRLESVPSQDLWKFYRPNKTRLFFFNKP